jgi:hypothetical protein
MAKQQRVVNTEIRQFASDDETLLSRVITGYLAPYFQKMKFKLKGHRFDTTNEIQAKSQRVLHTLSEKDFQEALQKLRRRCLHAGGNYFECDGGR